MLSQWLLPRTLDSTHVRPGILERGTHELTISLWDYHPHCEDTKEDTTRLLGAGSEKVGAHD